MVSSIASPIRVYAGDTLNSPVIRVRDNGGVLYDFDLAGWGNWRAQWRNPDESVVLDFTVYYENPGVFWLSMDRSATSAMGGDGVWDLQGDLDGETRTWFRGRTAWQLDVTR